MGALLACLVAIVVSFPLVRGAMRLGDPPDPVRPSFDLSDHSRKIEAVLSGLAGFAFTSVVLLITLTGSRLDPQRTVDLIALLVVAYLGFVVASIMYANTEPLRTRDGTDLQAALYATASTQFYRSITSGWLALAPLMAIVGDARLTYFVLGLLFIAIWGGWLYNAANLMTLGFMGLRFAIVSPVIGLVAALIFAVAFQLAPQLRTPNSVLYLTGAGAVLGAMAHFNFHGTRALGLEVPPLVTRRLRGLVGIDAHVSEIVMSFLWFAVAGLL